MSSKSPSAVMGPNLRSNSEKSEDVISFLKGESFEALIRSVVNKEVALLQREITSLKSQVEILKQSNIDLIRLLTGSGKSNVDTVVLNNEVNVETPTTFKKQQTFAEKVKADKKENIENTRTPEPTIFKTITNSETDKWQTVAKKPKKNKIINTVYGSVENTTIKGATQYSHFHVTGLEPDVSEEDVKNYLKAKDIDNIKCSKMIAKRPEEYSSFKLSVPFVYKEQIKSSDTWPLYVRVNPFLYRLIKKTNTE